MKPTHTFKTLLLYPFRDSNAANKMFVGGLLILSSFIIPIIPLLIVMGYGAKIARRIIDGDGELILPAWDDWNAYFKDGVNLLVVTFVYNLPVILVSIIGFGADFFSMLGMIVTSANGQEPTAFIVLYLLSLFVLMISIAIVMLLAFVEGIFLPAVLMHVVHNGSIKSAFQLKSWFRVFRKSYIDFCIAFIFLFGMSNLLLYTSYGLLYTLILCMMIPIFYAIFGFYLTIIAMPIYAQAYRAGLEALDNEIA